ncbi:MAG: ATP synthase F1 subunit delta [Rickettsiales bacterium]
MSENLVVANRYTRAIFELATAQKCVATVLADLAKIQDVIMVNKSQKTLLIGKAVPTRIKRQFWEQILANLKLSQLTANLVESLLNHNRMDILSIVAADFAKLVKVTSGYMSFSITSAKALDAKTKAEIANELETIFAKKIEIMESEDAKLLGGFLISSGSMMLDCSLKGRLDKIKQGFNSLQS